MTFDDAVTGLLHGDFSRLEPVFRDGHIVEWLEHGRFDDQPEALAEALTCASFLGYTVVAERLLAHGVNVEGGNRTGLNALHWAVNRGQLEAVRLLLRHGASLETRSMYDGDVLDTARWSAEHEPRPAHAEIITELERLAKQSS